jgi:hypothetical protein
MLFEFRIYGKLIIGFIMVFSQVMLLICKLKPSFRTSLSKCEMQAYRSKMSAYVTVD